VQVRTAFRVLRTDPSPPAWDGDRPGPRARARQRRTPRFAYFIGVSPPARVHHPDMRTSTGTRRLDQNARICPVPGPPGLDREGGYLRTGHHQNQSLSVIRPECSVTPDRRVCVADYGASRARARAQITWFWRWRSAWFRGAPDTRIGSKRHPDRSRREAVGHQSGVAAVAAAPAALPGGPAGTWGPHPVDRRRPGGPQQLPDSGLPQTAVMVPAPELKAAGVVWLALATTICQLTLTFVVANISGSSAASQGRSSWARRWRSSR
jgi:hypothetical protein